MHTHTHTHTYIHTYIHTYVYTYIYAHTHTRVCVCVCVYDMHTYIHMRRYSSAGITWASKQRGAWHLGHGGGGGACPSVVCHRTLKVSALVYLL